MIILLEGADCSGKTTLAGVLREQCGAEYFHHTQDTNSIFEFSDTLAKCRALSSQGKICVIDRLWLSEIVYGPIMRGYIHDAEGVVMALCHMYGVVTVVCVREDMTKHLAHFREVNKTRQEYAAQKIEQVIKTYYDAWYGASNTDVQQNPLRFIITRTPLRMLRSYYQYDMDKFKPEEYVNWLVRMEER